MAIRMRGPRAFLSLRVTEHLQDGPDHIIVLADQGGDSDEVQIITRWAGALAQLPIGTVVELGMQLERPATARPPAPTPSPAARRGRYQQQQ